MIKVMILLSLLSLQVFAKERDLIRNFLEKVKENSLSVKSYQDEGLSNELNYQAGLTQFDLAGELDASFSKQETPPLSPFTSLEQKRWNFGGTASKLWESGFETSLNYSVIDNTTLFNPNASSPIFSYVSPTLEFKVTTNLLQDLVGDKYGYLSKKNKSGIELSQLQSSGKQKEVLVVALFDLSQILEDKETTLLQRELCEKIKKQSKKLRSKYKRKSVSKREFLQSKKELNVCRATVGNLQKNLDENISKFSATYSFDVKDYMVIENQVIYSSINNLYQSFSAKKKVAVDLQSINVIKELEIQKQLYEYEYLELKAESKANLALEMKAGVTGVGNRFGEAQKSLFNLENPYVYAGLTLDLPFSNKETLMKSAAKRYKLESLKKQLELKKRQVEKRIEILIGTLKQDMDILNEYKSALSMSQSVYKEAQRDFENGRLDFNDVIEFSKSLINDQKQLSTHRFKIIVRAVELLDYYQYFNEFVTNQKNTL